MEKTLVLKPRVSEKAYMLSASARTYVVDVPTDANKDMVAKAMTAQFGVAVASVNIVLKKGKRKRTVRKGGRPTMGRQSDVKKAYVTLKEGETLPFFAEIEEQIAESAKAAEGKKETK